jgi:sialate O-acetylesterase
MQHGCGESEGKKHELSKTMCVMGRKYFSGALFWLIGLNIACAEVHLAPVFGSNMVLQRDVPMKLTGWADVGEKVAVKLGGKVVGNVVGAGKDKPWIVKLPVQKAGGMPDITVEGKNIITLSNLLAGDVWVCSGQSNMTMPLEPAPEFMGVLNWEQERTSANYPQIRFFNVETNGWKVCDATNVRAFSAAGYFFGREIQSRLNIPVGLMQASVNGTRAELWTPLSARMASPGFKNALAEAQRTEPKLRAQVLAQEEWEKKAEAEKKAGPAAPPKPYAEEGDIEWKLGAVDAMSLTGYLYDRMIAPLTAMQIKGVIWYQGESNSRYAAEYPALMAELIGGWRKAWHQDRLPFLMMQLVSFDSPPFPWYHPGGFTELRAAQQTVADTIPDTGLAIGVDIGVPGNIHPPDKQDVGKRLALIALKQVYGRDVVASGPTLTSARFRSGKVVLAFDPGGKRQKLVFKNERLNSFELAGPDGKFVPAAAEVQQDTITLTAPNISAPQKVRYAWADNPPVSLFNIAGLPTAPFERDKDQNKIK